MRPLSRRWVRVVLALLLVLAAAIGVSQTFYALSPKASDLARSIAEAKGEQARVLGSGASQTPATAATRSIWSANLYLDADLGASEQVLVQALAEAKVQCRAGLQQAPEQLAAAWTDADAMTCQVSTRTLGLSRDRGSVWLVSIDDGVQAYTAVVGALN